jgi:sigma-B regulation protein RsbU (phosphoserine phosphatase)
MTAGRHPRLTFQAKLLLTLAGVTLLSVATVAALSINSIIRTGSTAKEVGGATLQVQIEEFLTDLIVTSAEKTDLELEGVRRDVLVLVDAAEQFLRHPEKFPGAASWRAEDQLATGPEGQHYSIRGTGSEVFVPNYVRLDAAVRTELEQLALLDQVWIPLFDNDPKSAAMWYIGESGVFRAYPPQDVWTHLRPDFVTTVEFEYQSATPAFNPEREVVWSDLYDDAAGLGLMVSAMKPIFGASEELLGVLGIDITLARLTAAFEEVGPVGGGYWFLINTEGQALALPSSGYEDILGRPREETEFGTDLTGTTTFDSILPLMMADSTGFESVTLDDQEHFVTFAPMSNTGWSLGYVVEAGALTQVVADLQNALDRSTNALIWGRILPAGLVILAGALLIGVLMTRRLLSPVERLATAAEALGEGKWDYQLPPAGKDEIGVLTNAFGTMATELRSVMEGLEQRVSERTRELQDANAVIRVNEQRLQDELNVARDIQMSMIPLTFPVFEDRKEIGVYATLDPAREVGGDFYDYYFVDDDHLCCVIGDVAGKGAGAALFMAVAKTLLKTSAMTGLSASQIVTHVNEELSESNERSMFVTLFTVILNVRTGKLTYTNAGHNPPYVLRGDGTSVRLDTLHGPVVGAMGGMTYKEDELDLQPGDKLYFYTDGVTEAMDAAGALYTEGRLVASLESARVSRAQGIVSQTFDAVKAFIGSAEQADDITIVAIDYLGGAV